MDSTDAVAPPTACVSYMLTLPHGARRPSSASRVSGSEKASSESRRNALRHLVLCEGATSRKALLSRRQCLEPITVLPLPPPSPPCFAFPSNQFWAARASCLTRQRSVPNPEFFRSTPRHLRTLYPATTQCGAQRPWRAVWIIRSSARGLQVMHANFRRSQVRPLMNHGSEQKLRPRHSQLRP